MVVMWVGGYCDGQPRNTKSSYESMVPLYITYIKAFIRNWLIHDCICYPYNVSVCFWGILYNLLIDIIHPFLVQAKEDTKMVNVRNKIFSF